MKKLEIPVLRWPGDCFADEYHWMDGIGSKEKRPSYADLVRQYTTFTKNYGDNQIYKIASEPNADDTAGQKK